MKVINVGNHYEIYDDTLQTFDHLPAAFYEVGFSEMSGFYLSRHHDIAVTEKVYGKHLAKADKVLRSFSNTHRNLGVILSGKKGIGKSMFAKLLSIKAVKSGLPVILVERFIPGVASYLESIEQECVVMFDEYDKTFGGVKQEDGKAGAQTEMLGLFDGMAQGKKLFVITCNELSRLSDYLVNRPGRFHYHIRFDCPSEEEVREYLVDAMDEAYHKEIDKVVAFSKKVDLNYDCLRAIAFELNNGEPFETAILDMNIVNTDTVKYNVELRYAGGYKLTEKNEDIDLFDYEDDIYISFTDEHYNTIVRVSFDAAACHYDAMYGTIVPADAIDFEYPDYKEGTKVKEKVEALKAMHPESLVLRKVGGAQLHYALC